MREPLYYLQNVERGYVGNSIQWWKWNDNGYTCDIRAAKKFEEKEALELCAERTKYKMWPIEHIDRLVQHHIDIQDLKDIRLEPHTMLGVPSPQEPLPWEALLEYARKLNLKLSESSHVDQVLDEWDKLKELLNRFKEV